MLVVLRGLERKGTEAKQLILRRVRGAFFSFEKRRK